MPRAARFLRQDLTRKRRVVDHGPAVPDESLARTRNQRSDVGSVDVEYWDGVSVWLTTSGDSEDEVLTWSVYVAAPETSLQSKFTVAPGANCASAAGERSDGAVSVGEGGGGGGEVEDGSTVSVSAFVTPFAVALMCEKRCVVPAVVEIAKLALDAPAATVTDAGTVATVVSELDSATTMPPEGAA